MHSVHISRSFSFLMLLFFKEDNTPFGRGFHRVLPSSKAAGDDVERPETKRLFSLAQEKGNLYIADKSITSSSEGTML